MTDAELALAITNRANEIVQDRIRVFQAAVGEAAHQAYPGGYVDSGLLAGMLVARAAQLDGRFSDFAGYPRAMWVLAEIEVRKTLFSAFDPLQRVLRAKEVADPAGEMKP